jgi:hypothetical protein
LENSNNRAKGTSPALDSICTIDPERSWLANGDKRLQIPQMSIETVE